jgi:hypothetical protein
MGGFLFKKLLIKEISLVVCDNVQNLFKILMNS